ncbi:MAG: flagellar basal body-associated FliL family protein [bacterium]
MAEKDAKTVQVDNLRDDDAAEKAGPATGSKPLPWLVLVVGLLVMLLTPTASYFVAKSSIPANTQETPAKKEPAKAKAESKEPPLLSFNAMLVNVKDTKGTRVLKITPNLMLSDAELKKELESPSFKTLLKDLITDVASAKTLDDLDGPTGRENLKKDILARINKMLVSKDITGAVADVYFDEFLIQ